MQIEFKELVGKILKEIKNNTCSMDFETSDGEQYELSHDQD